MELREGYKNTEIGVIPDDWEVKTYDDVFDFLATATYSRAELTEIDKVRYVHYGDIHTKWNFFLDIPQSNLPTVRDEQVKNYHFLKDGDVIMADASEDYPGIGKSVEVKNLGSVNAISGLHTFLFRDKNEVFVNGFRGYIHFNKIVKTQFDRLATGLKVYGVSKGNLKTVLIPVPTRSEQTAIATALSDADALISSLEKLITKKRNIKQGAMQKLLQPKEGWVVKKLGESCEIFRGGSPRPIESYLTIRPDGINWIKIGDVKKNAKYVESTEEKIIAEGLSRSRFVNEGDFLLSNSMSFGRPYIMKISGCIHDGWLVIQNYQNHFDRDFLYYVLGSETILQQYKTMASGSSVLNLNKEIVKNVLINCPKSVVEQARIATILSDMDAEITALETKLDKYRKVKLGMMQNLLTGKIRLI